MQRYRGSGALSFGPKMQPAYPPVRRIGQAGGTFDLPIPWTQTEVVSALPPSKLDGYATKLSNLRRAADSAVASIEAMQAWLMETRGLDEFEALEKVVLFLPGGYFDTVMDLRDAFDSAAEALVDAGVTPEDLAQSVPDNLFKRIVHIVTGVAPEDQVVGGSVRGLGEPFTLSAGTIIALVVGAIFVAFGTIGILYALGMFDKNEKAYYDACVKTSEIIASEMKAAHEQRVAMIQADPNLTPEQKRAAIERAWGEYQDAIRSIPVPKAPADWPKILFWGALGVGGAAVLWYGAKRLLDRTEGRLAPAVSGI